MEIKYFHIDKKKREEILKRLTFLLKKDEKILFAFVHGSFIIDAPFRDIDIAVWLKKPSDAFHYTVYKSIKLEEEIGIPVDLHVLNTAPITFKYHVITKGKLLFTRDPKLSYLFIETTLKEYWDFKLLQKYACQFF